MIIKFIKVHIFHARVPTLIHDLMDHLSESVIFINVKKMLLNYCSENNTMIMSIII